MARKLFNFCLAWALVLGCWGGILAAAACRHAGCVTAAAAPEHDGAHGAHSPAETHEAASTEDHCAHAEAKQGRAQEKPAVEQLPHESVASGNSLSSPHDTFCFHCVGRPEAPRPTKFEWSPNSAGKVEKDSALRVLRHPAAPPRLFVREITPAQHAPPFSPERHLLLGVFRI